MAAGRIGLTWTVMMMLLPLSLVNADQRSSGRTESAETKLHIAADYLFPQEESRDIRTLNLNIYYPIAEIKMLRLSLLAGLTATFASGEISQLEGELSEGTLHEVTYDSDGIGIGPGLLVDLNLLTHKSIAFHLQAGGGVLLYDRDFPAGGDRYNFMWRVGPVLRYGFGDKQSISFGWIWTHVSNGQGFGSNNPSYDAHGPTLQFAFPF